MADRLTLTGKKIVGGDGYQPFGTVDTNFKTIYNDMFRFRKIFRDQSAGVSEQLFYAMDQPGHFFFKVFFYFSNPYADPSDPMASNLLGTVYKKEDASTADETENTALNYLYNNLEYTRFNMLAEFIQLLSDVSTKSPWYFQSVSGLDQAVERTETGRDFKIEEERKSITLKCLPDAYDNRIGRLIDLYRAVVYSQNLHKWILPRNLRKFDMGIYLFNSPIKTLSGGRYGVSGSSADRTLETPFREYYGNSSDAGENQKQMLSPLADFASGESGLNSKYIELRGCEIDYNSSKNPYAELDNAEGKPMEYEIVIKYDTAVEDRYDPVFRQFIGDFVLEDLYRIGGDPEPLRGSDPYDGLSDSDEVAKGVLGQSFVQPGDTSVPEVGMVDLGNVYGYRERGSGRQDTTILSQIIGHGQARLGTEMNKILLGNLYGFSLSRLQTLMSRDPMGMVGQTVQEVSNASLIRKRVSDFTDPNRGTELLSGKNLYNGWTVTESNGSPSPSNLQQGWVREPSVGSPSPNNTYEAWYSEPSVGSPSPKNTYEAWYSEPSVGSPNPDNIYG